MQDFFDTAEPRTFAMMLIAVVLLVGAVEGTYLLWPQLKNYRALNSEYQLLDSAMISGESLAVQLTRVDEEVKKLSRQLHGDMAQLPVKQMESFVIGRLQKVSWATKIELVSVQPGEGKQVQNFRETLFEVKLLAGFHNFFEWLQIVNEELGYIVVNKFEISPKDSGMVKDPKLDISLTLVSYRMVKDGR